MVMVRWGVRERWAGEDGVPWVNSEEWKSREGDATAMAPPPHRRHQRRHQQEGKRKDKYVYAPRG